MDWLTKSEFQARYPPTPTNPHGVGTHVLHPIGSRYYYDTKLTGGFGGKANSRPGAQNARFHNAFLIAGPKGIAAGDEIFVSYGKDYKLFTPASDDVRENWCFIRSTRPLSLIHI